MDICRLEDQHPICELLDQLRDIVDFHTSDGEPRPFDFYIEEWLAECEVIDTVGGDFGMYMLVIALAVAQFHDDPSFFGEDAAEKISEIFSLNPSGDPLPKALSPYWWKERVFRRLRGDRLYMDL